MWFLSRKEGTDRGDSQPLFMCGSRDFMRVFRHPHLVLCGRGGPRSCQSENIWAGGRKRLIQGCCPVCCRRGSEGRCNNTPLTVWYADAGLSLAWSCSRVSKGGNQPLQDSIFRWSSKTTRLHIFLCQTDVVSWGPCRPIIWLIGTQLSHL